MENGCPLSRHLKINIRRPTSEPHGGASSGIHNTYIPFYELKTIMIIIIVLRK